MRRWNLLSSKQLVTRGIAILIRFLFRSLYTECRTVNFQAISILLQDELAKVAEAVEAERLGEIERKLRRAERRSGGLCNPAQLETLVRTSSLHGMVTPPAMVNPNSNSTSSSAHWGDGSPQYRRSSFATNRSDSGLSSMGNCLTEGRESVDAGNGSSLSGGVPDADTPWADDLLNAANRRRYAAMLRGRGRSLAKDLTLLMPTVVREVQGVVARLPPWDDESGEGDIAGLVGAWVEWFCIFLVCVLFTCSIAGILGVSYTHNAVMCARVVPKTSPQTQIQSSDI